MNGRRFDQIGTLLAASACRRSTLRSLAAGALAIGLGRLSLDDALAACKNEGKKCDKDNECCSKKCSGKKCRCRKLEEPCTGTVGSAGNTCCGSHFCATTPCSTGKRCCKGLGSTCEANCECCQQGSECKSGKCCLEEGAICAFVGSAGCCAGLFCDPKSGVTCQPKP